MTDQPQRADRRRQFRISTIWIVPAVAVLVGAWMIYDTFMTRGPLVTLEMKNAEGIEAGKTPIKTRNVQIGRVEEVRLSEDLSHTVIEARLREGAGRMLNSDTRFWVVKPRIGREGISGLNTVLSGAYIQLLPGTSDTPQREFDVLDAPPVAPPNAKGLRLTLVSGLSNSVSAGDPVTYEGVTVGRVESARFDPDTREITHQIFIQSPYDTLVTDTTRFWTASGVNVDVGSNGLSVDFESLESLFGGGITFGVPEDLPRGHAVESGTSFQLYPDLSAAREGSFDRYLEYVLLVEDTVRGLDQGAPVEYRGLRVGTVVSVPWELSVPKADELGNLAVPVLMRIEPRRIERDDTELALARWRSRLGHMMKRGLRASLKTGNLITGALFVDLNFRPNAPAYEPRTYRNRKVFPITSSGVAQIQHKVTSLLDKLNGLDVEQVLTRLDRNLRLSEQTLQEIRATARSAHAYLDAEDTRAVPDDLRTTLKTLRGTLDGFSGDSDAYQQLTSVLERLDALMQDLQPVVRILREQPNALIFDKRDMPDPQPRAPRR